MKNFDVLCVIEAKMNEGIFLPSKLSDYSFLNKPILCFSPANGTLVDLINKYGGGIAIDNEDEKNVEVMNMIPEHHLDSLHNPEKDSKWIKRAED